jgi:hypothetical protein
VNEEAMTHWGLSRQKQANKTQKCSITFTEILPMDLKIIARP